MLSEGQLDQEIITGYVCGDVPLGDAIKFLVENGIGDSQILVAVHERSPNFGSPELAAFRRKLTLKRAPK